MNNWLKEVSARLLVIFVLVAALAVIGACNMPTGSNNSTKSTYEDDLALFIQDVEDILCDTLLPSIRLSSDIKNVVFEGFSVNPLDESNDNAIMIEMNFTNIIILEI